MEVSQIDEQNIPIAVKAEQDVPTEVVNSTIDESSITDGRRRSIGEVAIFEELSQQNVENKSVIESEHDTFNDNSIKQADNFTTFAEIAGTSEMASPTPIDISFTADAFDIKPVVNYPTLTLAYPDVVTPSSVPISRRCSRDTLPSDGLSLPVPGNNRTTPGFVIQKKALLNRSATGSVIGGSMLGGVLNSSSSSFMFATNSRFGMDANDDVSPSTLMDRTSQPADPQRQESVASLLGAMTRRRLSIASSELPKLVEQSEQVNKLQ